MSLSEWGKRSRHDAKIIAAARERDQLASAITLHMIAHHPDVYELWHDYIVAGDDERAFDIVTMYIASKLRRSYS